MFILGIVFGIIEATVSFSLGLYLLRIYFETNIKATLILVLLIFSVSGNGILFSIIMWASPLDFFLAYTSYVCMIVLGLYSIISLYLFLEYIEHGRVNARYFAIYMGLGSAAGSLVIFSPENLGFFYSYEFSAWLINLSSIIRGIILIMGIIIIAKLIIEIYKISKEISSRSIKKQFIIAFIGIAFSIIGLFLSAASGVLVTNIDFLIGSIIRGSYPLFLTAGLVLATYGFMQNPYSIYVISQKVYQIIVFLENGVTIFDEKLKESPAKQTVMITGAIHGVSSMIQHALGIDSRPKSLKYGDRSLIFEFRENIGFVLISDRDSRVLRNGLKNFATQFMKNYSEQIINWKGEVNSFITAKNLIKKAFPFLDV